MSHVTAAILLVLSTLQLPRPAAPAATVVSEDESLRGISAMSVTVQVQGKLIDAAATKADIETKLRQRGIGVLNRGLPRLHLQVDYVPAGDGRNTYAVFAMRLELAQALTRQGGAGLVDAVTWSNGSFGILGDTGSTGQSRKQTKVSDRERQKRLGPAMPARGTLDKVDAAFTRL